MNKNIYKLVDVLLKSDFLTLERTSQVVASKHLTYKFLDPFEITRSVKEFLRSLRDVRSNGTVMVNIYVEDKFKKHFLDMCFSESNVHSNVNVITSMKEVHKLVKENQLLLVIGSLKEGKYKDLLFHEFYRIHVVNGRQFQKIDGCYVIPNSMTDLKKIVFLIILILKVIKA